MHFPARLALNLSWPIVFFGWHATGAALIALLLLFILIAGNRDPISRRISVPAAWLPVPCLAGCCFAAVPNAQIWMLN